MRTESGPDWRAMAINLHDALLAARGAMVIQQVGWRRVHKDALAKIDAASDEFNRCFARASEAR